MALCTGSTLTATAEHTKDECPSQQVNAEESLTLPNHELPRLQLKYMYTPITCVDDS